MALLPRRLMVGVEVKWSSPMPIEHAAVLGALKPRPGGAGMRGVGGATAGLDRPCARRRWEWVAGMKEGEEGRAAGAEPRKRAEGSREKCRNVGMPFPFPFPPAVEMLGTGTGTGAVISRRRGDRRRRF